MKKTWKTFGTILGMATAITLFQQPASADDNPSLLEVNALGTVDGQVNLLDTQVNTTVTGNVDIQIPAKENESLSAVVSTTGSDVGDVQASLQTTSTENQAAIHIKVEASTVGDVSAKVLSESGVEGNDDPSVIDATVDGSPVGNVSAALSEPVVESGNESSAVEATVEVSPVADVRADILTNNDSSEEVQSDASTVLQVELGPVSEEASSAVGKVTDMQTVPLTAQVEGNASISADNAMADNIAASANMEAAGSTASDLTGGLQKLPLSGTVIADVELGQIAADEKDDSSTLGQLPVMNDLSDKIQIGLLGSSLVGNEERNIDNGGLLHVYADDLPLLGESHVGVLDEHMGKENTENSGLAQIDLTGSVLNNVSIDALGKTATDSTFDGSVVDVNADALQLLGEAHVGLLDEHLQTDGTENSGVAQIDLTGSVLNNVSIDALSKTATDSTFDGGVVDVNADALPLLGEAHVGVLDKHTADIGSFVSDGVLNVGLPSSPLGDVQAEVLTDVQIANDNGSAEKQSGVSLTIKNSGLVPIGVELLSRESITAAVQPPAIVNGEDNGAVIEENPTTGENPSGNGTVPNEENGSGLGETPNHEHIGDIEVEGDIVLPPAIVGTDNDNAGQPSADEMDFGAEGLNGTNVENGASGNLLASNTGSINTNFMLAGNGSSSYSIGSNVLPKTGGFFDGWMLALIGLLLAAGGFGMRKLA